MMRRLRVSAAADPIAALFGDRRGVSAVEFAILAPVLCLFLVGAFDIAHSLYLRAALQGIIQKTGRDSGLEMNATATQQAAVDQKITNQVKALANNSTITISRRFYRTFSAAAAARAEDFTDTDRNGTCNGGEPYVDANNNGTWDSDGGDAGQGGAKDRTLYTVVIAYPRMFPLDKFISVPAQNSVTAQTVLQNQPYTDQGSYTVSNTVRYCP